jgi:hypothetical protein
MPFSLILGAKNEAFLSSATGASPAAALIGCVEAPDAEQAIRIAIREFAITNPEHQKRLVALQAE